MRYTTWADWISDTRIGQEFYLGDLGECNDPNPVVWGLAQFGFTQDEAAKLLAPQFYTGYQLVEDWFCWGSREYCESRGIQYMESLGWEIENAWETTCDGNTH